MSGRAYDVEGDIGRATQDRAQRIARGEEMDDATLRERGGIVISARASVLMEHFAGAHIALAVQPAGNPHAIVAASSDAQTTARRLVEYIGALEEVCLGAFSAVDWDTPVTAIGLAAATLEGLAANIEAGAVSVSEETAAGLGSMRDVAQRLRHLEARLQAVPGAITYEPGALVLPVVPPHTS